MVSKTPQFDSAIEKIIESLVPHTRECLWAGKHKYCEGNFEITNDDINFLKIFKVPPPKYCPTCRRIRRFVCVNTIRLFKRPCDAPGHREQVISTFSIECPFSVVDYKYYMSDEFDPFSYGADYVSGVSVLDQLFSFRKNVPIPSLLNRDPSSINSEYSGGGRDSKNCYFTSGCFHSEDIWYSGLVNKSREVMDSRAIRNSDTIYQVLNSEHLYKCAFVYFSKDCSDSTLLFDCRNCDHCFGSVNLRNKRYVIFNEQKTKEEYDNFISKNTPLSYNALLGYQKKFWALVKSNPVNASRNSNNENVSGVLIESSRNLFDITDAHKAENIRHADGMLSHHDSMDVLFSGGSEQVYQVCNVGSYSSKVKFSAYSKFTTDCEFVFNSKNISNCFMCVGLESKSFCILNKQYSEEEYWPIVDQIKTDMLTRGEYGEFFDMKFSPQAYNFSLAGINFPLTEDVVNNIGGYFGKEPETNMDGMVVVSGDNLPDTIDAVDDSFIQKGIICEVTGRPFRIIATELAFYRKMKLPLPHVHPSVRMEAHHELSPTGIQYKAVCALCNKDIKSIFNPEDSYILYCESCFQKEVV
jgi:hypothetical protein